jgi:hypothetical protein
MSLNRAFGNVQIASDFGVVTSLQKQFDDLAFPGSDLAEILIHNTATFPTRSEAKNG